MTRLLIFLAAILMALVISNTLSTAVNRHYDYKEAPPSATDLVIESRQTPPEPPAAGGSLLIVATILAVLAIGGLFAYYAWLKGQQERAAIAQAELLKQQRLLTKQNQNGAGPQPLAPVAQGQDFWRHLGE